MRSVARKILIIEDSESTAQTYVLQLKSAGHQCVIANHGEAALEALRSLPFDCILLDLKLPDMDGMEILRYVEKMPSPAAVIVVTSNGSTGTAIEAMKCGAHDYLIKPFPATRLTTTVQNALAVTDMRRELKTLRLTAEKPEFCSFIGNSSPMQAVYRTIETAAHSSAPVFITGETGTGKELAAEALHRLSNRQGKELVAINCAAIQPDLMESMLFGHVKGAFTGAHANQEGAASRANGGTLFLDEIGEMDMGLQSKLLRFAQSGEYQRVGDTKTLKSDIRLVAATNRDPIKATHEGRLRSDLYYRLNVVPIHMPPLRERGNDILLIARHFLIKEAGREGKSFASFAPDLEARLLAYHWPGNVRQLENVIRRVAVLNDGEVVTSAMLAPMDGESEIYTVGLKSHHGSHNEHHGDDHYVSHGGAEDADGIIPLAEIERRHIEMAITKCGDNIHLAARKLGISPSTIYRKKESWGTV